MRGIVGEERRGKETDGCPLTTSWNLKDLSGVDVWNSAMTRSRIRQGLVVLCEVSLGIREGCGDEIFGDPFMVGSRNDNPNTTQTLEYTKDKYNAKIIK
jgi:hypothetical protein